MPLRALFGSFPSSVPPPYLSVSLSLFLFCPFCAVFLSASSSLSSLLFHAWPATENRELSALPRPYALSLFLGLVVTHTGEKRRANRQPTMRKWRSVEKLRQAWLTRRSFAQIILFLRYEELPVCHSFSEIPENRYRYACEFFFRFEHVNTLTATRVFAEISVRGHALLLC